MQDALIIAYEPLFLSYLYVVRVRGWRGRAGRREGGGTGECETIVETK
jgi:hypothetical protein